VIKVISKKKDRWSEVGNFLENEVDDEDLRDRASPNHIIVLFSLPFRSEPSHLLNHLVKFVSNENILRVLTIIVI